MTVPKGRNCKLEVAASYATAVAPTALTKASPGEATLTAHGLTAGTIGYWTVLTGMLELNGWVGSVQGVATNTWNVERVDTTGFSTWVSNASNTFTPVATWTTVSPATQYAIGGGAADELDLTTLLDTARQIEYGMLAAETVSIDILSDMQTTALVAIEAAARAGSSMTFRITLSNTERRVFRGIPSLMSETQGISQAATGSFSVAVKGPVLRLPVAS